MGENRTGVITKSRAKTWRTDLQPRLKEARYMLYLTRHSLLLMIGIVFASSVIFLAVAGPMLAPYSESHLFSSEPCPFPLSYGGNHPCPATTDHLLGTDDLGYDILSRILYAVRLDISFAIAVVSIASVVGILLGAVAGYVGGKIDELIMRVTDVFLAFPGLVLALAIGSILGRSWTSIFIALIVVWWPGYVRLIRGQVLSVRENQFIEAARAVGSGTRRIVLKHIIPHIIPPMFVYATIDLGGVILTLAALSFLGLAGTTTTAELGAMIASSSDQLFVAPWTILYPGLVLLITSLSFNLIGDGMRDILDPRLRR